MSNNTGIIYKVTSPNGKVYIGQTIHSLNDRKARHIYDAYQRSMAYAFANAIIKYGDLLKWEILYDNIPIEQLNKLEIKTIEEYDSYNNGYNSSLGGEGSKGNILTEETKSKISAANKGKLIGNKNPMFGKTHSNNAKQKISQTHKGKIKPPMSQEIKDKISKSKKGKYAGVQSYNFGRQHTNEMKIKISNCQNKRKKSVYRLSLNGEILDRYNSLCDAAKFIRENTSYKASPEEIREGCKKEHYTRYGFKWRFANE